MLIGPLLYYPILPTIVVPPPYLLSFFAFFVSPSLVKALSLFWLSFVEVIVAIIFINIICLLLFSEGCACKVNA